MAKLTEKKIEQKIKFHKKKVWYYTDRLHELKSPKIGFDYKNRNK